jgi:cytoskeleton protein RodZ
MRFIGKVEAVMAKSMSEDTEDKSVVGQSGTEPKTTVGSVLRSARLARGGKSISEIAEDIRVRPHQLQALEDDDYDKLPGMIYATGFIRAYAKYLDLDGEELVDRFRRTARTEDLEARLAFPEPMEDPRIPRRSLVAVACTLALAIYGTWYGLSGTGDAAFEKVPTVDSRLAGVFEDADVETESPSLDGQTQAVPASKASQISGVTGDQAVQTAAVDTSAVENEEQAVIPDPLKRPEVAQNEIIEQATDVVATQGDARPQVLASLDPVPENENLQSSSLLREVSNVSETVAGKVAVRAREDAWVRIEGPDSKPVIDTVLRAGEIYQAPTGAEFTMMTGNAGALDILIDGKSMGALGPRGEIRRHVALDPSVLGRIPAVRQQ